MKKCYVVHRQDLNNVGDIASNPLQYFMKPDEYEIVDIANIGRHHFDEGAPVIAGGGGLLENESFTDSLRDLVQPQDKNQLYEVANTLWTECSSANITARDEFMGKLSALIKEYSDKLSNSNGPRILWGAGHNGTYDKKFKGKLHYANWLRDFNLVGVRDYNQQYKWVPCASCMHPALRKKYTIKNDVIWFEHKKQMLKATEFGSDPIPRFINSGENIEQTIEILGSANIIITNSYHGAYWGTLLGKKVIVAEAWSSKFNAMKHMPYFLQKGEYWRNVLDNVREYPTALEDSIYVTEQFWQEVKDYIK